MSLQVNTAIKELKLMDQDPPSGETRVVFMSQSVCAHFSVRDSVVSIFNSDRSPPAHDESLCCARVSAAAAGIGRAAEQALADAMAVNKTVTRIALSV